MMNCESQHLYESNISEVVLVVEPQAAMSSENVHAQGSTLEETHDKKASELGHESSSLNTTSDQAAIAQTPTPTQMMQESQELQETAVGYQPSDYEMRRLERIKRNTEYLASLGLNQINQATKSKRRKTTGGFSRDDSSNKPPKRKQSKRLEGKDFIFNEDELLRKAGMKERSRKPITSDNIQETPLQALPSQNNTTSNTSAPDKGPEFKKRTVYRDFVYKELKRLKSLRNQNLKSSERLLRRADNELRIAEKNFKTHQRKRQREVTLKRRRTNHDILRRAVINAPLTIKLLKSEQIRTKLSLDAAEHQSNLDIMGSLSSISYEFPRALTRVEQELDHFVLQTLETDQTQMKTQLAIGKSLDNRTNQNQAKSTAKKNKSSSLGNAWHNGFNRQVNGPVKSEVAKALDSSWLDVTRTVEPIPLVTFLPQPGDLLIYYPEGHREFLSKLPEATRNVGRTTRSQATVDETLTDLFEQLESHGRHQGPVPCIVLDTWPEFPSHEFKKCDKLDSPFVCQNRSKSLPMPLRVVLKPVTCAQEWVDTSTTNEPSPQAFSFQLFPSRQPFLLPLGWACAMSSKGLQLAGTRIRYKRHQIVLKGAVQNFQQGVPFPLQSSASFDEGLSDINVTKNDFELPKWKGLKACWDDGTTTDLNPWEVTVDDLSFQKITSEGGRPSSSGNRTRSSALDQTESTPYVCWSKIDNNLRAHLEHLVRKLARQHDCSGAFMDDVTEEIAPKYFCFVPLGMSVRKILRRLKENSAAQQQSDNNIASCYYRSIASIVSDVREIYSSCVLYNQEGSEIVKASKEFTYHLANAIASVEAGAAAAHQQEILLRQPEDSSKNKSEHVNTKWLLRHIPDESCNTQETVTNSENMTWWIPQVGDYVYYNYHLHMKFVAVHKLWQPASELHEVLSAWKNMDTQESRWIKAKVSRTQPVFMPDDLASQVSFNESSTVLRVTLIREEPNTQTGDSNCDKLPPRLFWRPCRVKKFRSECPCGYPSSSFLRPAWVTHSQSTITVAPSDIPRGIDPDVLSKVLFLLQQLRFRCDEGIEPDCVNTNVTTRVLGQDKYATLGQKRVTHKMKPYFSLNKISKAFTWSPAPYLCLDLVMLRLQHGYYRQLESAVADVNEAFFLLSVHLMGENTLDVLRSRICNNSTPMEHPKDDIHSDKKSYEPKDRYLFLRKVYGTALLCICRSSLTERAFVGSVTGERIALKRPSEREKQLEKLINALGDDPRDNYRRIAVKEPNPVIKIKPMIDGIWILPDDKDANLDVLKASEEMDESLTKNEDLIICTHDDVLESQNGIEPSTEKNDCMFDSLEPLNRKIDDPVESIRPTTETYDPMVEIVQPIYEKFDEIVESIQPSTETNYPMVENFQPESVVSRDIKKESEAANSELVLFPEDYESNPKLVRAIFGKPGRRTSCARCLILKNSFICCRVRYRHSNPSLSPKEIEHGGLLSEILSKSEFESQNTTTDLGEGQKLDQDDNVTLTPSFDGVPRESSTKNNDPKDMLEMARRASFLAKKLNHAAETIGKEQVRLSERFIKTSFPVDPEDNHYTLCCVCGYGGNMLLCEGCPMVAHASCYNLEILPEGDWYCKSCTSKSIEKQNNSSTGDDTTIQHDVASNSEDQFKEDEAKIEAMLDDLRNGRQKYRREDEGKSVQGGPKNDLVLSKIGGQASPSCDIEFPDCDEPGSFVRENNRTIYFAQEDDIVWKIAAWCSVPVDLVLELNEKHLPGISRKSRLRESTAVVLPPDARTPDRSATSKLETTPEKLNRTVQSEAALSVGRKRGRPRRFSNELIDESPRRSRGRPRKVVMELEVASISEQVVRPRGRPRKIQRLEVDNNSLDNTTVSVRNLPKGEPNTFTKEGGRCIYFAVEDDLFHKIAEVCEVPLSQLLHINKMLHPGITKRSRLRAYTPVVLPLSAKCPEDANYVDPAYLSYSDDDSSNDEESEQSIPNCNKPGTILHQANHALYFAQDNETTEKIAFRCKVPLEKVLDLNRSLHEGLSKRSRLKSLTAVILPVGTHLEEGELTNNEKANSASFCEEGTPQKRKRGRPRKYPLQNNYGDSNVDKAGVTTNIDDPDDPSPKQAASRNLGHDVEDLPDLSSSIQIESQVSSNRSNDQKEGQDSASKTCMSIGQDRGVPLLNPNSSSDHKEKRKRGRPRKHPLQNNDGSNVDIAGVSTIVHDPDDLDSPAPKQVDVIKAASRTMGQDVEDPPDLSSSIQIESQVSSTCSNDQKEGPDSASKTCMSISQDSGVPLVNANSSGDQKEKRKRGRPRKYPLKNISDDPLKNISDRSVIHL